MNFTPEMMMRAAWERDRLIVPVPWNRAEAVQTYLRDRDVNSTLCLEPMTRDAHLELHTTMGAEAVQALLDRWEG
jgi:hypothetical protein